MPFRGLSAKTVAKIRNMFLSLISCFFDTLVTILALFNGKCTRNAITKMSFKLNERCPKS